MHWIQKRYNDGERYFSRANLRGADLGGADLWGADLWGADLNEANLRGADLRWADLSGADLNEANLRGADLREADLSGADLSGADLNKANLRGADLRNTCLDQMRQPNQDVAGFEAIDNGQWVVGYRTKSIPHGIGCGNYKVGQERWAHQFSTAETECHPGIFVCPTIEEAERWGNKLVKVIFRPWECHRAGNKHRVRWLIVWEDV